jgi:hypothetical protein
VRFESGMGLLRVTIDEGMRIAVFDLNLGAALACEDGAMGRGR